MTGRGITGRLVINCGRNTENLDALRINKDSAIAVLAITLDSHLFTDVALIAEAQFFLGFAYFITLGRKVYIPFRAIEPDPVNFLVLGDFIDHLVNPGAVVFEHLEVSRMENDLA